MGDILTWLTAYSLPVVLLIGLGSVLLYVAKLITDKSIARQFDKYATTLNLQLQRRSRFEELILIKRYEFLSATRTKLDKVITNINRMHQGTQVEGFAVNGDIVPLTEAFEDIANAKYLLSDQLFDVLQRKAMLALEFANATDEEARRAVVTTLVPLNAEFDRLMIDSFGLDRIGWID